MTLFPVSFPLGYSRSARTKRSIKENYYEQRKLPRDMQNKLTEYLPASIWPQISI